MRYNPTNLLSREQLFPLFLSLLANTWLNVISYSTLAKSHLILSLSLLELLFTKLI